MLKSEFVGRTHYCPDYKEYHYIEESYYESPLDMDEFCRQWQKDYRSGKWALELKLRIAIDKQATRYQEQIDMLKKQIEFYEPYYERAVMAEDTINEIRSGIGYAQFCIDKYQRIEKQYKDEDKEDAE